MNFKPGDRVQFKSWEEMEKEYGLDKDGDITPCGGEISFVRSMRFLCGAFATVESINKYGIIELKDISPDDKSKWEWDFSFSEFMLKPAKGEKKYRVGDKVQYNGSTYICDGEYSRKEDTDKYELHIMSDGKKTTAVYKKNGEIVSRSEANLHPDDEFNFKTGAQIAFDRVFQPEPEKKEPKKLRLFDAVGNCYGTVGTPTKYKDAYGRPLFVGDIVEIENAFLSLQFVCEDEDGAFICGIKKSCNIELGVICGWTVRLATPFTEVKDGTNADVITCRLK